MTPDPDEQALRRAVCASPDDDLPRLVLADYLEERGRGDDRDRATFIRVQCEHARTVWMSARWRKLFRAAEKLRLPNQAGWSAAADGVARFGYFARGFVDSVQMFSKRFTTSGDRLMVAEPVRAVRLIGGEAGQVPVADFLASPPAARLRHVDFGAVGLGGGGFDALARAALPGLAGVEIADWPPGGAELPAVVRGLPGLTRLRVPRAAVLGLVRDPVFRQVRELDLMGSGDSGGVITLAQSPHAAGLRVLELGRPAPYFDRGRTPLDRAAASALAASPHLAGLTRLGLAGALDRPNAPAVADLARSATLRSLEVLDLSGNPLTDAAVRAFAGAAFAPTLKVLVVRQCGLARANARRFAGLFPLAEVVV